MMPGARDWRAEARKAADRLLAYGSREGRGAAAAQAIHDLDVQLTAAEERCASIFEMKDEQQRLLGRELGELSAQFRAAEEREQELREERASQSETISRMVDVIDTEWRRFQQSRSDEARSLNLQWFGSHMQAALLRIREALALSAPTRETEEPHG